MKTLKIAALSGAALLCAGALAQDAQTTEESERGSGWAWAAGEGITFDERPIVTGEFDLALDSKYMTYGLVDNRDPIATLTAELNFFDWLVVGEDAIFDLTSYGRKAGWRNRGGLCSEFDPYAKLEHVFSADEYEWLPTSVKMAFGYMYEYHGAKWGNGPDTQYVWFKGSLPDLVVTPTLFVERDLMRDEGTYANLELAYDIELAEGLTLTPAVSQGIGNRSRVKGYLCNAYDEPVRRAGLMDTCISLELCWDVTDYLSLSCYGAYYDYLFDRHLRDASRRYEASGRDDSSYSFVYGVCATLTF